MRSGVGTINSVVGSIPNGSMVDFTGRKTNSKVNNHYWAEVTYGNITGWVAATFLRYELPSTSAPWVATGGHGVYQWGVATGGNHSCAIIFADPNSGMVRDNPGLFINTWTDGNGVTWRYGTLGAASDSPSFGNLVVDNNRGGDVGTVSGANAEPNSWFAAIGGNYNYGNVLNLITLDKNYRVNHNGGVGYDPTPWPVDPYYNSNSYTYSLLRYAGISPPGLSASISGGYPGWGQLIPRGMFN